MHVHSKEIPLAQRLETLDPGTPVFCGSKNVGTVQGVYAEGEAELAEHLAVFWTDRGEIVLVPTRDVETIEARGVVMIGSDPGQYANLLKFDPAKYPTVRKIR